MSTRSFYLLVPDLHRAMTALVAMDDLHISTEAISLVIAENFVSEADKELIDQKVIHNVIGRPTHIGAFHQLGPLMVIGPVQEKIRAAFIGLSPDERTGESCSNFILTLMKMGIPAAASACYASGIRGGRILMAAHPRTDEDSRLVDRFITDLGVKR